jgi:zinc/manganese transport system permease protein
MELLFSPFVIWALVISIILAGIHSYLGAHIVRRGIIFTDLALAQFAVLGSVIGNSFGLEDHSWQLYLCSLSFSLIASLLFALIKRNRLSIPIEALIGISYAFASALTILIIVKNPESADKIKEMLVGSILLVSPATVWKTAVLYSIIGFIHFYFRKQIFARSMNENVNRPVLWDFIFYGSLSVVVTSSVEIAGVLLVFSFLVIPSIISLILSSTIKNQLIVGWVFGIVGSVIGIILAIVYDFPVGPMIVVSLTLLMIPIYLYKIRTE